MVDPRLHDDNHDFCAPSFRRISAWSLWIGVPLYWLLVSAMRRPQDVTSASLAFGNSVFVSVGSTCVALILGAMAGYGLARLSQP